jgi:hypothetical protein
MHEASLAIKFRGFPQMTKGVAFLIRPKFRLYFSSFVFCGLLLLVGYYALVGTEGAGLLMLLGGSFFVLFESFKYLRSIEIREGELIQKSFYFLCTDRIRLDDNSDFEVKIAVFKYLDRFKPTVRLEIYSHNEVVSLVIAIKLFDTEDIDDLMAILDRALQR